MALQSARAAGLEVPGEVLQRAAGFLDSVAQQGGSRYKYMVGDSRVSPAMTAEGLLCRQYLGWRPQEPALQDGVRFLLQPENLPKWSAGRRNVYYWYYATQVMHHVGGPQWQQWNDALRDEIVGRQVNSGPQAGSWHPSNPRPDPMEYGEQAGRLYVTAMCLLTLEVYYRHLPLYGDVDEG